MTGAVSNRRLFTKTVRKESSRSKAPHPFAPHLGNIDFLSAPAAIDVWVLDGIKRLINCTIKGVSVIIRL